MESSKAWLGVTRDSRESNAESNAETNAESSNAETNAGSNADPASIAVTLDGFPPLPKDTKGRARQPLPPGLEKWGIKLDAETGGKQMSTVSLKTMSKELILACGSVLTKTATLFIFCVSQGIEVLDDISDGDYKVFGREMPAAFGIVLGIWNILYPLLIAQFFIIAATEHVILL